MKYQLTNLLLITLFLLIFGCGYYVGKSVGLSEHEAKLDSLAFAVAECLNK